MIRAVTLFISLFAATLLPLLAAAQQSPTRATVRLDDVTLRASLDSLMRWYPVSVVYLDADIEGKRVSAVCADCALDEALERVLAGTGLTWIRTGNQVILMKRTIAPQPVVATISGSVTDSITGQHIAGATVVLEQETTATTGTVRRWCPTNDFGFYAVRRVPPGAYIVEVRALGYSPVRQLLSVAGADPIRMDVAMRPEEIRLQEVTIEGHRTALSTSDGYARGIYISSAPTDQTQYVLDGARIYNPSHFGGVLSTFNEDILTDVDVTMGGLPPSYGGRIGGILDLAMRDGSRQRLSGSAGTGSLGSSLALEGPIGQKTAFLFSWRRGYPDPAVPFLSDYGTPSPLGSTEVLARVSHRLSGSQQVSISGYAGTDAYDARFEEPGLQLSNNFGWNNRALSVRWSGIALPSLFLSAGAAYTGYGFSLEHIVSGDQAGSGAGRAVSDFDIDDFSIRAHADHYYDDSHTVRGGVELVHRRIDGDISRSSTQIAPISFQDASTWELSVYVQDQWAIAPGVSAGLGARATSYTGNQGSASAIDPRFSLLISLGDDARLFAAFTSVTQFVHTYRNSGVFLLYPPTFQYPSTETTRPTSSMKATLGVQTNVASDAYALGAEAFYRVMDNVHGFLAPSISAPPPSLTDAIHFGSGLAYGLELSIIRRVGNFRWALGYTLAWAEETYADINGGNPIPSQFDRRHELQGTLSWEPAEGWNVGALFVLASDETRSLESLAPSEDASLGATGALAVRGIVDVNGSRMPGFQRLEVEVARSFPINAMLCTVSLRLLNAYGLTDPFVLDLFNAPDGSVMWKASLDQLDLFPLFPTLAVSVRL